jgi:phosphate transport system permease protein
MGDASEMSERSINVTSLAPASAARRRRSFSRQRRWLCTDSVMAGLARLGAVSILFMLAALIAVLTYSAWPSITHYGTRFLITSEWRPNELEVPVKDSHGRIVYKDGEMVIKVLPPVFGALPVIYGTVVSSILALLFAVPLSFGAALFLVRLCPKVLTASISFLVEFLAAIPSIAYGMWGLFVLAPFLQRYVEPGLRSALSWIPGVNGWLFVQTAHRAEDVVTSQLPLTGRDMFCGGLVLAIMILPIITAISRDVLKSVPRAQIEGALALGATWWQSSFEMLRYSRSALFGAVMLGLARAAGETMAITMVIGNNNQINRSLFAPAQTMSSLLANEFAEASSPIHRSALTEVALILLVMSLLFNITARWLVVGSQANTAAAH